MLPRDLMGTTANAYRLSNNTPTWAPALKSPCAILKSAGLATCSARRKAGTSSRSVSISIASFSDRLETVLRQVSQAQAARRLRLDFLSTEEVRWSRAPSELAGASSPRVISPIHARASRVIAALPNAKNVSPLTGSKLNGAIASGHCRFRPKTRF